MRDAQYSLAEFPGSEYATGASQELIFLGLCWGSPIYGNYHIYPQSVEAAYSVAKTGIEAMLSFLAAHQDDIQTD